MNLIPENIIAKIISRKIVVIPPEIPDNELDIGLNHEVMGSIPQVTLFNAIKTVSPEIGKTENKYSADLPPQGSVG